MLTVRIDNVGDASIVECEGTIVSAEDSSVLRDAAMARQPVGVIVMDLSKVWATAGNGLSMLVFLQCWAHDRGIQLKLFNPRSSVRYAITDASSPHELDFASVGEVTELLIHAANDHPLAA
jgi:hypothetical protein